LGFMLPSIDKCIHHVTPASAAAAPPPPLHRRRRHRHCEVSTYLGWQVSQCS